MPDTKRVDRASILCRDRRSIVTRGVLIISLTISNVQVPPRAAASTNIYIYIYIYFFLNKFPVFPITAVRAYLQPKYFLNILERKFATSRFHCHRSEAHYYRCRKHNRIFKHFGRLFLPGTIKNVSFSLNELFVDFQEESTVAGLADFAGSNSNGWPTAPVSIKHRNWENYMKQSACFV